MSRQITEQWLRSAFAPGAQINLGDDHETACTDHSASEFRR